MRHNQRLLIIVTLLLLTLNTFGQIDPYTAIGLGTSLGKGIVGKIKDGKKKKIIESSLSNVDINGVTLTILRVKEEKIISNAKVYIVRTQNQLNNYYKLYQANQHIDLPYNLDDIAVLKSLDSDWSTEYYENEFKEYRKYEQNLTKKEQAFKDSVEIVKRIEQKRIADSLSVARRKYQESLEYAERVRGFHFINKEYALLKEKPNEKSKTIGKAYLGSYIKVLGYSDNSNYSKVSLQGVEGFVDNAALVDSIEKINSSNADIATYRSRQYYKYEPNYDYIPEQEITSISLISSKGSSGSTKKRTSSSSTRKRSYTQRNNYIQGPRGGCYYITSGGTKVYVDRSYCR